MDNVKTINDQILKERACIDYLIKEFSMYVQDGKYEMAAERHQDVHKSITRIQQLERQKHLYVTAMELTNNGYKAKVVKRYARV
ncbi:MAG: hypothetical protein RR595_11655 [Lysinibacillus sp.]